MFSKILIANRGEIAVRILRSCQRLDIATVAIYSDVDADGLVVRLADEAIALRGVSAAETYLDIAKVISAAQETGADAIHPGYGFLSENTEFATACSAAGISFIGPGPDAIAKMGDKLAAKEIAIAAGVSTIPGSDDALADGASATTIAQSIGYPVMLKAAAGGGGKGMRVVYEADELAGEYDRASREAQSAFGDGRVFVEKYITQPRHIEIQILADMQGNVVHLGERECSIQRRHQKVIEEAPSPMLDEATRAAMCEQAVSLAKTVGYHSAGTVEFVANVDAEGQQQFYFLEMNTRLQVEHPVTEFVTGLDLVEWMIRVAAGESLDFTQTDISLTGWAVEARLYAEDPQRGFLPATGRITQLIPPTEVEGTVRFDSGIVEGGNVGVHYDPMLAKLICFGDSRGEAVRQLRNALDQTYIGGLNHNIGFLAALLGHPRFEEGDLSTEFIADEWPDGFSFDPPDEVEFDLMGAIAAVVHHRQARSSGPVDWIVVDEINRERARQVSVNEQGDGLIVEIGEHKLIIETSWQPGQPLVEAVVDGVEVAVTVIRVPGREGLAYQLLAGGKSCVLLVASRHLSALIVGMPEKKDIQSGKQITAPMPGLLVELGVSPGQGVLVGQAIGIIEAMKMENVLRSDRDGTIDRILVSEGDNLSADQVILEFE